VTTDRMTNKCHCICISLNIIRDISFLRDETMKFLSRCFLLDDGQQFVKIRSRQHFRDKVAIVKFNATVSLKCHERAYAAFAALQSLAPRKSENLRHST